MKKLLLIFAGAVCFTATQAQVKLKVGVKGGLNLSTFAGKDADDAKSQTGFHAGIQAQVGLGEQFSVQPEIVYSTQGAKGKVEGDPGYFTDIKDKISYLNIPIMFQYKHSSGLFAQTGPQVGILLSAKEKYDGGDVDIKPYMKKTDFSWALGIGYITRFNLGINARYNFGLGSIAKDNEEGAVKISNRVFQVGVFYVFDLTK